MQFKKVLGFWDLFWLGVGGMVGVAILSFPAITYQQAGGASIISWVLAGVFSLFMALVYAEMVTAFPQSGAFVVFPYEAFGRGRLARYLAFLEGIGYYLGTVFGIVISAITLGSYISPAFASGWGLIAVAEVSVLIAGIINIMGTKITSRANLAMSMVFMVLFAAIIVLGLARGNTSSLHPFLSGQGFPGLVYAIPIAILAYGSWTALVAIPEETRDIKKLPKAIFYSIVIVTVFYALIVLATFMNQSASQLNVPYFYTPVLAFVQGLNSGPLTYAFEFASILAIFAVMLVMVLANARTVVALSKLNFLPGSLTKMSGRAIPIYATIISFAIPMVLSAFPTQYYQYVIIGAIIGTGLPRIIDLAAYVRIRNRRDYRPTFRVRYGLLVALIALMGLVISELSLGISDISWSIATLFVLTAAFAIIEAFAKNRKASPS
ncbi:MAG: amino acid permease [Candidatus Micrarchaeota archaeon]|nr:amino acid permease [Candidatus Micrarchaeota archaeon]